MNFIINNIKWVMLISGLLTATMFYGLFAPQEALESMFGVAFNGTLESIVIRSWCALVGLIGTLLVYGAFSERNRGFALSVATISKVIFVSLILIYGREYWNTVMPAITMDCVTIAMVVLYLVAVHIKRVEMSSRVQTWK